MGAAKGDKLIFALTSLKRSSQNSSSFRYFAHTDPEK